MESRTKAQQSLLDTFEQPYLPTKEDLERVSSYYEAIKSKKGESRLEGVTYNQLYNSFKIEFKKLTGNELSIDRERLDDYRTLLCYFSKDQRFFRCENLNKTKSEPSFDKGLLIIGGYGNGKSSCLQAISKALHPFNVDQFKYHNANEVVDMYEACKSGQEKDIFWQKIGTRVKCFDDVKTERQASNYGKIELFKDVIEKRYNKQLKTFITCNYHNHHPNDLNLGLQEFGERYGGRVYDRLFEMFNIIEFKGSSLRK